MERCSSFFSSSVVELNWKRPKRHGRKVGSLGDVFNVGRYPYSALNLDWAPRTRPVKHWRSISCARVSDLWSNDTLKSLFTHFLIPFLLYYSFLNKRSLKVQSHLWAPSILSTKTWNVLVSRREVFISYRAGNCYLLLWSTLVEIYLFLARKFLFMRTLVQSELAHNESCLWKQNNEGLHNKDQLGTD